MPFHAESYSPKASFAAFGLFFCSASTVFTSVGRTALMLVTSKRSAARACGEDNTAASRPQSTRSVRFVISVTPEKDAGVSEGDVRGRPAGGVFVRSKELVQIDDEHVVVEADAQTIHVACRASIDKRAGRLVSRLVLRALEAPVLRQPF